MYVKTVKANKQSANALDAALLHTESHRPASLEINLLIFNKKWCV